MRSILEDMSTGFDTIEDAIEDIKAGKVVIVVDDEDRENEGDFVTAARMATPEVPRNAVSSWALN